MRQEKTKDLARNLIQVTFVHCIFFFFLNYFCILTTVNFFLKILFISFLERGEGKEKERERNIDVWSPLAHCKMGAWPATHACALTGNRTGDPLVRKPTLNPLSYTSQGCTMYFLNSNAIMLMFLKPGWYLQS